jgi:hypothetical protein
MARLNSRAASARRVSGEFGSAATTRSYTSAARWYSLSAAAHNRLV